MSAFDSKRDEVAEQSKPTNWIILGFHSTQTQHLSASTAVIIQVSSKTKKDTTNGVKVFETESFFNDTQYLKGPLMGCQNKNKSFFG